MELTNKTISAENQFSDWVTIRKGKFLFIVSDPGTEAGTTPTAWAATVTLYRRGIGETVGRPVQTYTANAHDTGEEVDSAGAQWRAGVVTGALSSGGPLVVRFDQ